MRLPTGALVAVLAVLAVAPAPAGAGTPLVPADGRFADEAVLENLDSPVAVRFAPPPDGRIFVAEKAGRVQAYSGPGDTTPELVVDIRDEVHDFWDRGLLGMALDPGFATNGFLYLLYTRDKPIGGDGPPHWGDTCPDPPGPTTGGCVVSGGLVRVTVDALGVGRDLKPLLEEQWCQQFASHSVGTVAFGPDGMLYAGAGDGASFSQADYGQLGGNPCGDPDLEGGSLRSQDVRTTGDPTGLDGAIVRVDPATGEPALGNPAGADANARRIIAYGLRNPFRFAFRPGTSEIWVGDVGYAAWEEIDRIADAGDGVAENFGWPCFEGNAPQERFSRLTLPLCTSLSEDDVTWPEFTYAHYAPVIAGDGCAWPAGASLAGIAFYGEGGYPSRFDGALFFADYVGGCIFAMRAGPDGEPDPSTVELFARPAEPGEQAGGPVELQVGPGGDLYYPLLDPEDPGHGSLRRIRFMAGNRPPVAVAHADPASGPTPLAVEFDASGSSDPDGDALEYAWDLDADGAFDDATGPTATWTYSVPSTVRAGVRVSDAAGATGTSFADVAAGGSPPSPVIDAPEAGTHWAVGEPIEFGGSATDEQDGTLDAGALRWVIALEHCTEASTDCHSHPIEQRAGVTGGTITGPEHEYPTRLVLKLIATDRSGLSAEAVVRLEPRPAVVSAATDPPGGVIEVDGAAGAAPRRTVIAGSRVTVSIEREQWLGGAEHRFTGWSDGDDQSVRVLHPGGDVALVARFAPVAPAGGSSPPAVPGSPAPDHSAPRVRVRSPGTRRLARHIRVAVRCSEPCSLAARAELRASGRRLRLPARARGRSAVVVGLPRAALARARRALRADRPVRLRLTVLARDAAGNRARSLRSIRLR